LKNIFRANIIETIGGIGIGTFVLSYKASGRNRNCRGGYIFEPYFLIFHMNAQSKNDKPRHATRMIHSKSLPLIAWLDGFLFMNES
jgi:hypothetical protein